ncbi:MAG: TylF/MycF/NovP-related O-methyltransferase [Vicinamibacterales bacterium]|nr:TylF/MycF/NovP-related O-methyltransferase [Vicinamibacterales bacterium]MDP7672603.1 TylF/MycF/NovP-related O-methyltransferase [Vicinamibacterales bacterium]HJO38786.1 TylF/MycF/NovP-related O-methyltransferase [Vicinamibacterales bacterium]
MTGEHKTSRSLIHNHAGAMTEARTETTMLAEMLGRIDRLAEFSCSDSRELTRLCEIAYDVGDRGVTGDLVECGVRNGGSAAALSLGLPGRSVWLYDSFEGLPPPGPRDGAAADGWAGRCRGTEDRVVAALEIAGVGEYTIRPGWFAETFAAPPAPERIALLHVDADWYDSAIESLERFYPLVADGGAIVLGDFGHWEGCREAYYDFCRRHDLKPLLERYGHSGAWWVKGRRHNRASLARWDMP